MTDRAQAAHPAVAIAIANLGGVLVALALPPWGLWPLVLVGIACLEYAVCTTTSRRRRAWLAFAFTGPWMLIGMAWMWFLTVPGYVVTSLVFAGLHAAAAALVPPGIGAWGVVARPAAHTLAEIVRITVPFGGIPLATLGIALSEPPFLGIARIGGVILLTWLAFQSGAVVAELVVRGRWSRPSRPARAAAGVAVLIVLLAAVAPAGSDRPIDPVTIAAVQGGGQQGTSALDVPSSRVTEAHLAATATIAPDDELDLVVWPENGIDVNDAPFGESVAYELVAAEAARLGVPLSVGVTVDAEFSAYPVDGGFVNAQVLVYPDGRVGEAYEKVRIVPFGEYVPLRAPLEALGAPLDRIPSDAIRGRDPAVVATDDGLSLGVMISWEVFFGDRGRAARDGEILINPTNGASYTGTIVQSQQVASSKLRAIETGRWVVQVSPTGYSAFVSPDGEVFQRTDVSERKVITMDVPRRTGTTWYGALGDLPWIAAVVVVLLLTLRRNGRDVSDRARPSEGSDLDQQGDGAVVDDRDLHVGAEPAGRDDRPVTS